MRIAFYVNIVSPHQLPLARALLAHVGKANFRYIHTEAFHAERARLGWGPEDADWILSADSSEARDWLESADVVYSGLRALDLFERRAAKGLKTFYSSERWFKPVPVPFVPFLHLSGGVRLLLPRFRKMVSRFAKLARESDGFRVLPIGVHAARDFRLIGVPDEKMTVWGYFVEGGGR